MKVKSNKKGFFFTLGIVLIILPLILFVLFYTTTSKTKTDDLIGKIRCDELHYFVEDVNEDIKRAIVIFGRRAAIYAIDEVITTGVPLDEYEFNCTASCGVNCSKFRFRENGSEAAIGELTLCGTLHGENVSYMINHTLSEWMNRIEVEGDYMNFDFNITIVNLTVTPYDAWNFASILNYRVDVADKTQMCYYSGSNREIMSLTSILGLEDVLFPLNTNAQTIKYINNCTIEINLETTAGCSMESLGNGTATGRVVYYSDITNKATFCSENVDIINELILIQDTAFGAAPCNTFEQCCFNISCDNHFAAVVNYDKNRFIPFVQNCDVTIPWITGTGDMDNRTPQNPGWDREEGCDEAFIDTNTCVLIRNVLGCNAYDVFVGYNASEINTTCYSVSNISESGYGCTGFSNGPSFFDRLDGNLNLSDKYVNQSLLHFNNSQIGIETLISPFDLDDYGVTVKENMTWVGYLYWQDVEGCSVEGTCISGPHSMRLDCSHAHSLNVDTACENVTECVPVTTTSTTTTSTTTTTTSTSTTVVGTTTTTTSTTTTTVVCGFSDTMESGVGGWIHGGDQDEWELGTPKWGGCYSGGSNCWATDLTGGGAGGDYYNNDANEWLKSESIDLTGAAGATLTFWTKYTLEEDNDFGYVEISTDGINWTTIGTYTGSQNSWIEKTIDVSSYTGNTIRIRFRLTSDWMIRDRGLYIDDMTVSCS